MGEAPYPIDRQGFILAETPKVPLYHGLSVEGKGSLEKRASRSLWAGNRTEVQSDAFGVPRSPSGYHTG